MPSARQHLDEAVGFQAAQLDGEPVAVRGLPGRDLRSTESAGGSVKERQAAPVKVEHRVMLRPGVAPIRPSLLSGRIVTCP
jgi:hypothetical protein